MTTFAHMTCTQIAAAYKAAKSAATKRELRAYVAERAEKSARKRWGRLLAAIDANDASRIAYYAATGDEKRAAAATLKAAAKPAAKAPAAKPARNTRKAPAKPAADADLVAMAKALGLKAEDAGKLAAFVSLLKG